MDDQVRPPMRLLGLDPNEVPLDQIDVSQAELFEHGEHWAYLERLRREDPVHYCAVSDFGAYWSVTKFKDIAYVDKHHKIFSSEPTITISEPSEEVPFQSFIQMDPPKHDHQRAAVQGSVAPMNLAKYEEKIRGWAGDILDDLPVGEVFDWVPRVSVDLTAQMLATLFDVPFEDRLKLTYWSDVAAGSPEMTGNNMISEQDRAVELGKCMAYFAELWNRKVNAPPTNDIISMLAHAESTKDLINNPVEFLGNLILLLVGGNDTTRNSISGGVLALNQFPDQYQKLRDDPGLIPNMISEIIRWQTPVSSMTRRVTEDTELGGKKIRKGEKVVMWFISGNRDDEVISNPDELVIDRENARHHLSFGFGVHRCMGNRLAEMQLRIVWEEITKRFHKIEVMEEPLRTRSNMIHGYRQLMVKVHPL